MNFKFPIKFELMNETVKVRFNDKLMHKDSSLGTANYRRQKIILQSSCASYPQSNEQLTKSFYHELIHYIFYTLNEDELRDNEKLVDNMAGLFAQFEKTKKYK